MAFQSFYKLSMYITLTWVPLCYLIPLVSVHLCVCLTIQAIGGAWLKRWEMMSSFPQFRKRICGCINVKATTFIVKSKSLSTLTLNNSSIFLLSDGLYYEANTVCHDKWWIQPLKTEMFAFSSISLSSCVRIFPLILFFFIYTFPFSVSLLGV